MVAQPSHKQRFVVFIMQRRTLAKGIGTVTKRCLTWEQGSEASFCAFEIAETDGGHQWRLAVAESAKARARDSVCVCSLRRMVTGHERRLPHYDRLARPRMETAIDRGCWASTIHSRRHIGFPFPLSVFRLVDPSRLPPVSASWSLSCLSDDARRRGQ